MGMRRSFCAVSKNIAKPLFFFFSYGRFIKQGFPVISDTLHSQRFPSLLLIVPRPDMRYVLLVGEHVQRCKGY